MSKTIDLMVEANTIKYSKALEEEFLPKLKGLKFTEETLMPDDTVKRSRPREATLSEKLKFCHIYAERQARLQRQIEWLHAEQEKHRKYDE